MSTNSTAGLQKSIVARLLSYHVADYGGATIQALAGGRVYVSQAPDDAVFPCVVVRLLNRQTAAEYSNQRELFDVEIMVYGRPRSSEQAVEDIADLAVQALLTWVDTSGTANVIKRSQTLEQGAWTKVNATVVADADPAPDLTVTADRLVENAAAGVSHAVFQGGGVLAITPDASSVFSIFARPSATRTWLLVHMRDTGLVHRFGAYFNLATGAVGQPFTQGTGKLTRAYVEPAAGGFYRCVIVGSLGSGVSLVRAELNMGEADGDITYDGDGVSYLTLWGAQLEDQADHAGLYIPTTALLATSAPSLSFGRVAQRDTVSVSGDPYDRELVAVRVVVECVSFGQYLVDALQA